MRGVGKWHYFVIHILWHGISSKNLGKVEFTLDAIAISWNISDNIWTKHKTKMDFSKCNLAYSFETYQVTYKRERFQSWPVPVLQWRQTARGQHSGPAQVLGYNGGPVQATSGEPAPVVPSSDGAAPVPASSCGPAQAPASSGRPAQAPDSSGGPAQAPAFSGGPAPVASCWTVFLCIPPPPPHRDQSKSLLILMSCWNKSSMNLMLCACWYVSTYGVLVSRTLDIPIGFGLTLFDGPIGLTELTRLCWPKKTDHFTVLLAYETIMFCVMMCCVTT